MKNNAEQIFEALFELVAGIGEPVNGVASATPLATSSRRWRAWSTVGSAEMPAFFQMQTPGIKQVQTGHLGLTKYQLKAALFFYFAVNVDDTADATSPTLNAYYAAVDAALQPTIAGGWKQQLGGLVENCWIDGDVLFDEGLITPPAMLVFPITILTG
jgi:hypothetical protein